MRRVWQQKLPPEYNRITKYRNLGKNPLIFPRFLCILYEDVYSIQNNILNSYSIISIALSVFMPSKL